MLAKQIDTVPIDEAYEHLAKSIVIQAIEDYRKILNLIRKQQNKIAKRKKKDLEKFFLSDWCYLLSGWDGEELMQIIQEQEGAKNVQRLYY